MFLVMLALGRKQFEIIKEKNIVIKYNIVLYSGVPHKHQKSETVN